MKTDYNNYEEHFNRRDFLKGFSAMGLSAILPYSAAAADLDYGQIDFDPNIYSSNNAQTIIVYLYGGPSELGGNLTNIAQINAESQNPYPSGMNATTNHFWAEAGGDVMESLLASGDMNLFRTCYRTVDNLKAHGECTSQAQRGKESDGGAGIIANLASILCHKGAISEPTGGDDIGKSIPFVTMEGESTLFREDDLNLPLFVKPVAFGNDVINPYERTGYFNDWVVNQNDNTTLGNLFDTMSQNFNPDGKIKEAFERREVLEKFMNDVKALVSPVSYPPNNTFADRLEFAMKLLIHNEHTKVISIGSPGLGGWDDHSNAISSYSNRMQDLMSALNAAVAHMHAKGRSNINIVVFGEFGRNVNYNNSEGWDHGNNQNVYWFGGAGYMNQLGIVGETELSGTGSNNRLFLRPKNFEQADESYHFQVFSIAATIYNMYGITNPEILTQNNYPINGLLS